MKKLIVSLALASSALVAAAPALAQYYGRQDRYERQDRYDRHDRHDRYERDRYEGRYDDRGGERFTRHNWFGSSLDRIHAQISRGLQNGRLSYREADMLKQEHGRLWQIGQRYYAYNGLQGWERADLERRLDRLQQRLRYERRDGDYRRY
jgi:hypothetical protein